MLTCLQLSAGLTLRVQANLWPKMSWLGDVVRLWLEHPHVLGPYCQQLCCGWVQPPCRGFGKADFSPRVFHRPGSKSASNARRCGCPRLQERHPGAGASRVSPGEARLMRRPVGNHLEEQIHTSTVSGEPDCLTLCF